MIDRSQKIARQIFFNGHMDKVFGSAIDLSTKRIFTLNMYLIKFDSAL